MSSQQSASASSISSSATGQSFKSTTVSSTSSSSKTMKSSSKSVQSSFMKSSSIQQQSSIEKVSSASITKQSSQEQVECLSSSNSAVVAGESINQISSISSNQEVTATMTNGSGLAVEGSGGAKEGTTTGGKKTKVERKTSKAGAGKKSKSNAEISKENISVTSIITSSTTSNGMMMMSGSNSNSIKLPTMSLNQHPYNITTQQQQQQSLLTTSSSSSSSSSDDFLVKKLGPGESRVFAKVCVANLRRSFGDLTAINGGAEQADINYDSNNAAATALHFNGNGHHVDDGHLILLNKYSSTSSSSLEYNNNRINSSMNNNANNSLLLHRDNLKTRRQITASSSYDILHSYGVGGGGGGGGPSSLPPITSYSLNSINSNRALNGGPAGKLQLFQPSYWEGLFCNRNNSTNPNGSSSGGNVGTAVSDNCDGGMKKSSFSKFDSLVSKNQQKELQENGEKDNTVGGKNKEQESKPETKKMFCTSCEKQVFQMELIRAEKKDWHKNCFRCVTCRKVLGMDTYQSHEQRLYCKPHFKELFQPKKVMEEDNEDNGLELNGVSGEDSLVAASRNKKSKLQLIICESQPKELPPDVVRASDTPATGLEDIQIDVRSKFEMFENLKEQQGGSKSPVQLEGPVKRSASVLAKLKKYENSLGSGGSELNGVDDEDLHGVDGIELQSDEDYEDQLDGEEGGPNSVIRDEVKRKLKNPLQALNEIAHFKQMEQVRSKWEEGTFTRDQIIAEERKVELQKFRSRLCQGKSGHLKEMYEKGVETGGEGVTSARSEIEQLKVDKAKSFREMFEKGEVRRGSSGEDGEDGDDDVDGTSKRSKVDLDVFEAGVAKESKRMFEEMDKKIVSDQILKEHLRTTQKGSGNRFIEKKTDKDYEDSEDAESLQTYRDPNVVRHGEVTQEDPLQHSKTTSKMLSVFRQMEESLSRGDGGNGPIIRPLKQFTPPRDTIGSGLRGSGNSDEDEEEEEEEEEGEEEDEEEEEGDNDDVDKKMSEDEFLKEVGSLARARSLRAKFERWEQQENERNKQQGGAHQDELAESIDSAKHLKAKFEAMRLMGDGVTGGSNNKENLKGNSPVPIRVNRFV